MAYFIHVMMGTNYVVKLSVVYKSYLILGNFCDFFCIYIYWCNL